MKCRSAEVQKCRWMVVVGEWTDGWAERWLDPMLVLLVMQVIERA